MLTFMSISVLYFDSYPDGFVLSILVLWFSTINALVIDLDLRVTQVRSSVAQDAGSMMELQQWNEQYGEGGTRKKTTLSYFM